jgi:gliding motility-associated-like protein
MKNSLPKLWLFVFTLISFFSFGKTFPTNTTLPFDLDNGTSYASCASRGTKAFTFPVTCVGTLNTTTNQLFEINIRLDATCGSNLRDITCWIVSPSGTCVQVTSTMGTTTNYTNTPTNRVDYTFRNTNGCLNKAPNYAAFPASVPILSNANSQYGVFSTVGNISTGFNGENADGTWTLYFAETAASSVPCVSAASIGFGDPAVLNRTANGENCTNAITWNGEPICASTLSKTPSANMPGWTGSGFTGACQWNNANNNDTWIEFTASSTNICFSLSGIVDNLQSIVVTDPNTDGDNNPCTGTNGTYWTVVSCPRDNIYTAVTGTPRNHNHCFTATVGRKYYIVVDGNGGAESPFYLSGVSGFTPPNITCRADTTVCINTSPFTLSGSTPTGGTYSGSGVSSNIFSPAVAGAGAHSIQYQVINGCDTFRCNFQITVNAPSASALGVSNTRCTAPFNGAVNLTTAAASYIWSNGAITEDISSLSSGSYTVTVTDGGGCKATASATVNNVTSIPSASAISTSNNRCVAPFNGSVNLTTTGNSYLWNNGAVTEDLTALGPGTFVVTVTDANGCTATTSSTVSNATTNPTASAVAANNTNCTAPFNGNVNLTTSGTSYIWSNSAITEDISGLSSGTYNVTVTGSGGCTATASATVNNTTSTPTASAVAANNTNCIAPFNGSVNLTTSATSYLWSNGAVTEDLSSLNAGTYTVTVTSTGGCTAMATATVNNTTSTPSASAVASNNTSCTAPFNGSVNLTTSGTSYIWSNGAITGDLNGLGSGTYTVTVTGIGGCTANASAIVNNTTGNQNGIDSIIACSSYTWINGTTYTSSNNTATYTISLGASNGCDSIVSLFLLISNDSTFEFITSCNPADTGVFVSNLVNQYSCDSVHTIAVSLLLSDSTFEARTSCNLSDVGVTAENLLNQLGCDSVHIITTTYSLADTTFEFTSSCNLADTGIFVFSYTSSINCDSFHVVITSLSPSDSTFEFNSSCNPADTGVFVFNNINQFGCDSVHTRSVSLSPSDSTFEFTSSCNPTDTGVFVVNLTNQYSCDSVHTRSVALSPSDSTFEFNTSANPLDTGVVVINGFNQFGCDSVHTITTTLLAVADSTFEFTTSCNPADTGVFVFTYLNQSGADSIHIVATTLLPSSASSESRTTCDASLVGVATLTLVNQFGCDSLHTITTTLAPGDATFEDKFSCNPFDTGTVVQNLINKEGCDSTHTIITYLAPSKFDSKNVNLCRGESIFVGGGQQNKTGSYFDTLKTVYGCDSIINTLVNVNELPIVNINIPLDTIANGQTITLSTSSIFSISSYLWTPSSSLDCDKCANPNASPKTTTTYTLNVVDQNGCKNSSSATVNVSNVFCDAVIPSAFSPNGDGTNDLFGPIYKCAEIKSIIFRVFNRWGEKVFETKNINERWNGQYKDQEQPTGVYVFYLDLDGVENGQIKTIRIIGNVTLLK